MNGFMIANYLKIKKALVNGDSVGLDGHFFNVFDMCLLEKKLKESFCCEDMRLEVESHKKIKVKAGCNVRFSRAVINFCPFCGKKFEGKDD